MSTQPLALPPGATLVSDGSSPPPMKLPPGATLISMGAQQSAQEPAPERPGFGERVGNAYGLTKENIGETGQRPSLVDTLLPQVAGVKSLYQMGKAAFENMRGAGKENAEAIQNVMHGQPVMPNVGKAFGADVEALSKSVAPSVQNLGEDVYDKNYRGAAGDVVGAVSQAALAKPGDIAAVPGKIGEAIPSTARAGGNFQDVMAASKNKPLPITNELSSSLARYQELADRGGQQSLAVRKLLNRITDPEQPPITYGEARDFYSNISRLSADEYGRLTPVIKKQIGTIRASLNDALQQVASDSGKGEEYSSAMAEYARAAKLHGMAEDVWNGVKGKIPWLATLYGGKTLYDVLSSRK